MHAVVQRTALVIGLSLALSAGLSACRAQHNDAQASQPAAKASAMQQVTSQFGSVGVTTIASGLEHPWSVALLPDGSFLVTERPGRLRRVSADGKVSAPLSGVPAVWAEGQGGLLDVVLAPDFANSRRIYLSYAEPGPE
ncbi:MAG TPA: PQQ-dependent sugar dehydrogenase, partial [Lysobacter sp.]